LEAVKVVEVTVTWQFNVPVTAVVPVTLIVSGEDGQVTPDGSVDAVTTTFPVKPPLGVTVIVDPAAAPDAELNVSAVEATVNVPRVPVIVKVTAAELLAVKLGSPL